MTLAARTRAAARARPFLLAALRAGVCNHAAAARTLDVDGDPDAVATALRRYAEAIDPVEDLDRRTTVRLRRGLGAVEPAEALLSVGDVHLGPGGDRTGVLATGELRAVTLGPVLGRLAAAGVAVEAAAAAEGTLLVVVPGRAGADSLRAVERALDTLPDPVEPPDDTGPTGSH